MKDEELTVRKGKGKRAPGMREQGRRGTGIIGGQSSERRMRMEIGRWATT